MLVRSSNHLKAASFYCQNVTSRCLATQVAAKIDTSTTDDAMAEYSKAKPFSSIPGPSALAFVRANLPGGKLYNKDLQVMLRVFRQDYGDLMKMPGVLGQPSLIVSHNPDHFQTVFRTEGHWPSRIGLQSMQYHREKLRPDIYGKYQGLVNTQGKEWGEFRTAVNPVLIQPKNAKRYIPTIDEVATDFLERIRQIRNKSTNQLPADFEAEMNKWTLESIGVIGLDTRLGLLTGKANPRAAEFMAAVKKFFDFTFELEIRPSMWRVFPTPAFKVFMKTLDILTNIAKEYVNEARARLEARPSGADDEHEQSVLEKLLRIDENIAIVMAIDMVFAGVDTTSSAFTGVLYALAKNPDKQETLRKEVMGVLPEKDSVFTVETMRNLPYLRACLKEAQRIMPTLNGNVRGAGQDLVLDGYQIPKGTFIVMSTPELLKEDKNFPEGSNFIPERWLKQETAEGKCPASAKSAHPFIYLPFGFGPRMCIGRRFAEMEIEIMIAKLIRNFYISWEQPDLKFKCTTLNIPDSKLMFTLKDVEK